MQFIKIATQMFPAERIEKIDTNANIGGSNGVEVKLHGIPETFTYTGEYAELAYNTLEGITPAAKPPSLASKIVVTIDGVVTPVAQVTTVSGDVFDVSVLIEGKEITIDDIEWVDFAAQIGNQNGVEVRVATDAPGVTRQFTGNSASAAYDVLAALSGEETTATASN